MPGLVAIRVAVAADDVQIAGPPPRVLAALRYVVEQADLVCWLRPTGHKSQCQIYEADSEVVTGEMRDFSTLVPRLLEQLQRERDGQPLTSRRLVVFVFNGHNHYDATVPQ